MEVAKAAESVWANYAWHSSTEKGTLVHEAIVAGFVAGAAWRDNLMQSDRWPGESEIDAVMEAVAGLVTRQQAVMTALDTMGGNIALIMKQNGDHGGIVGKIWANTAERFQEMGQALTRIETDTKPVGFQLGRIEAKIEDVGQKVEAVGYMVADEVEVSGITEPMHAEVKAEKPEADAWFIPSKGRTMTIQTADDDTLNDLHRTGQITTARFLEEQGRRMAKGGTYQLDRGTLHVGVDLAKDAAGDGETAYLLERLRKAEMLEAFWRRMSGTRGDMIAALRENMMTMGDLIDNLTGRNTGA